MHGEAVDYFSTEDRMAYFETLKERPDSVVMLIALWKKRVETIMPGCPCNWGRGELKKCIEELSNLHERHLYD